MGLLDGKVALITGAAGGIGRAVATRFAHEGARVVVNDLGCDLEGFGADDTQARQLADELVRGGAQAVASAHDVSTPDGAREAVQTAVEAFGALDVLVTAAGIVRDRTVMKMDERAWSAVLATALGGSLWTLQAAARQMISQGTEGRVVLMSGQAGYLGAFGQANMAAACGAIHGLMRTAAIELQKHRITVNAIAPLARTRLTESQSLLQGFDNVTAEHVVPVALMLASDLCAERSGHTLAVAGPRVYSFRFQESPGKFKDTAEGVFTPQEVEENWRALVR